MPPKKTAGKPAEGILCVGQSGMGKTTFVRNWTLKDGRTTYVVDGDEDDFKGAQYVHIDMDEAASKQFSDCNVVLEDLSMPAKSVVKFLRYLLVRRRRHNQVNVLVIVHSVKANHLGSNVVSQFTSAVFCHGESNLANMVAFFREQTKLTPEEGAAVANEFVEDGDPFTYLVYDLKECTHHVLDRRLASPSVEKAAGGENIVSLRRKVSKFLPQADNRERALQLFDYLFSSLPLSIVKPNFRIAPKKSGASAHLLDLLHAATTDEADPSQQVLEVFKSLRESANVPDCLVVNRKMR